MYGLGWVDNSVEATTLWFTTVPSVPVSTWYVRLACKLKKFSPPVTEGKSPVPVNLRS